MTLHRIELATRDGEILHFDCAEEQNLLEAAAAANILLPSQCGQGACGACHATALDGDFELGEHNAEALPRDQAEHRHLLMCRSYPRSALRLSAPYERSRIRHETVPCRAAKIVALEPIADNTVRLLLRLQADEDGGHAALFEPGQFAELELPGAGIRRAYSLANNGNWDGQLEFFIRLQPQGLFSGFLQHRARVGDTLIVRGPQGAFGLRESGLRPRWFVAGGTGLAPILAMLRRMADWQEPQPARLYFGVNRETELFAAAELMALQSALPQLHIERCVWQPRSDWPGFCGTPAEALQRDLGLYSAQPDLYLCGPPALIARAEAAARQHGLADQQIISERFSAG